MKEMNKQSTTTDQKKSHFGLYSLILLGICINCYFNSLEGGFCFDDKKAILANHDIRETSFILDIFKNDFWGTPMYKDSSHKSYRPLCVLTFRWNYAVHGLDPAGYHLANMICHWILCVLILKIFQMFFSEWLSFLSAILFMVHPVHTEAVTGIVGRAELLSSIGILLSLKCYEKGSGYRQPTKWNYIFLTLFVVFLATLSKEQGITAVAICCAYEVLWLQKVTLWKGLELAKIIVLSPRSLPAWFLDSLQRMLFLLFTSVGLMMIRIVVMGAELPHFTVFDNPASTAPTPDRQLTYWYLLPLNFWILLYPFHLLCDYSMGTIPLVRTFADPRNMATLNFVAATTVLTWFALTGNSKTSRQVSMALAFMVFPFLPATNLLFPVGFVIAERILFTPSMGFTMLVVIGIQHMLHQHRFKTLVYILFGITVILHGAKTARRNIDWKSEKSLFLAGLQMTTKNAKVWNNVGHAFERENRYDKAMHYFKQASIAQPDDTGAFINLGRAYYATNRNELAMETFKIAEKLIPPKIPGKSRRLDPKSLSIYLSMALILRKDNSTWPEAHQLYIKAIRMWSEYEDAYVNLGDFFIEMGELEKAKTTFDALLKFAPRNQFGLFNMGVVAIKQKDKEKALQYFETCVLHHPQHVEALFNVAHLRESIAATKQEKDVSIERIFQLYEIEPNNPTIAAKIGVHYKNTGDFEKAADFLRRAVELDGEYAVALIKLAEVYKKMGKFEWALETFHQYVKLNRNHLGAWLMMGDLYVNFKNDLDRAWMAFEEAQRIRPNDTQIVHNFCVIHARRQDYLKSKECLEAIAEYDPQDFIIENLEKLKNLIAKKEEGGTL